MEEMIAKLIEQQMEAANNLNSVIESVNRLLDRVKVLEDDVQYLQKVCKIDKI